MRLTVLGKNQGSLKKFRTKQKTDPNSWHRNTEELPTGWKKSDWLGAFRPTEHQWIYHAEMEWLYPPRWKMAASGYGTKQMDGAGLKQGYIHTYTVGETPLGFIYREKSMA